MNHVIFAAAQIGSIKGAINVNIQNHIRAIQVAVAHRVNLIVFPELSLTGYEPEIAGEVAIGLDDPRLQPLKQLAMQHDIGIIAGAPVVNPEGKPFLGALMITPNNIQVYHKFHLHPGEADYFTQGFHESCLIANSGEAIAMAICADVGHRSHAAAAARAGATVYAAGVLMMDGYGETVRQLQQYARQERMAIMMANYNAPTGGYIPAGQSAVWDAKGDLLAKAGETDDALVLLVKQDGKWSGEVVRF